ncbi:MAG: hypothetical protein CME70_22470 [Halobacteriovorax sp.]|nr:hypothetical protein [Halobacteriovorax sp.]|tara:strand:+ start:78170 stop:80455 length:2286 start_codon:yes stop_codon:yes gene_type:complete
MKNLIPFIYLLLFSLLACSSPSIKEELPSGDGKSYLGAVVQEVKEHGVAIKLGFLIPGASGERMGMKSGDFITKVNGKPISEFKSPRRKAFTDYIKNYPRNKKISFKLLRFKQINTVEGKEVANLDSFLSELKEKANITVEKKELKLELVGYLDRRVYGNGPKVLPKNNKELLPSFIKHKDSKFRKFVDKEIIKNKKEKEYEELKDTFALLTDRADFYRRNLVTYVQKNPLELGLLTHKLKKNLSIENLAELMDLKFKVPTASTYSAQNDPIQFIKTTLNQVYTELHFAFKEIETKDKKYLLSEYQSIIDYIDQKIMLTDLKDMEKFGRLDKILQKINFPHLIKARIFAMSLDDKSLFRALDKFLIKNNTPQHQVNTRFGNIIIGGKGNNWYRGISPHSTALIIDLGGDDLYSGSFAGTGFGNPFSMVIDLAGNDIYEAARACSFGCGILGLGILIDRAGNDTYTGTKFSQGASFGGHGLLIDRSGFDKYESVSQSQAYSFYGISALEDHLGNDLYRAKLFSQGSAVAGGVSLLKDHSGHDEYEARGLFLSSYGTHGIFKSFSQGMGFGFRGFMSGGIGILSDLKGKDDFKGGNFSQAAGYYFGFGIFHNGSTDQDSYLGSRYSQGATAHYAVASFLEEGGNDIYRGRHEATASMAWDLGVTYFEDQAGSDFYDSFGMTLGSAAQNSYAFFLDKNGNDTYRVNTPPATIPTNEARDGISLGFFFDLAGKDKYQKARNNSRGTLGNIGFWEDFKNSRINPFQ